MKHFILIYKYLKCLCKDSCHVVLRSMRYPTSKINHRDLRGLKILQITTLNSVSLCTRLLYKNPR